MTTTQRRSPGKVRMSNGQSQVQPLEDQIHQSILDIEDAYVKLFDEDPNAAFKALAGAKHYFKQILNSHAKGDNAKWLLDSGLITKEQYRNQVESV